MRRPAVRPRPDQVAALTRGVRLPLAPIPDDLLEILAEGLSQAFHDIRADSPSTVTTGDEPEVTALMQARLTRMINEDTLWRQLVNYVARGTDSISFDGSHIEKSPDLSIVLSDAELRFPLIAEAKILDAATSKTVALYCKAGIRRFVDGEYAWGNREAFMIGYVRDGSSIDTALTPILTKTVRRYRVQSLPVPVRTSSSYLAHTRHRRAFVYPVPATAKQTRADYALAFVAGVGEGRHPTTQRPSRQPHDQSPSAHPRRHQSVINYLSAVNHERNQPNSARPNLSPSTTLRHGHPPLEHTKLYRFPLNGPYLFECLNHSTQPFQSTNYRNRTSRAMVKPCCSFNQIPRPSYNSLPLRFSPR